MLLKETVGVISKIKLHFHGNEYTCFTYLARTTRIIDNLKPYHWYKNWYSRELNILNSLRNIFYFLNQYNQSKIQTKTREKEMNYLLKN
jgi:retron-type reverse transcriptase